MYTDSQVKNISNIKQRLRATLTTWNGASREQELLKSVNVLFNKCKKGKRE